MRRSSVGPVLLATCCNCCGWCGCLLPPLYCWCRMLKNMPGEWCQVPGSASSLFVEDIISRISFAGFAPRWSFLGTFWAVFQGFRAFVVSFHPNSKNIWGVWSNNSEKRNRGLNDPTHLSIYSRGFLVLIFSCQLPLCIPTDAKWNDRQWGWKRCLRGPPTHAIAHANFPTRIALATGRIPEKSIHVPQNQDGGGYIPNRPRRVQYTRKQLFFVLSFKCVAWGTFGCR